MSVLLNILVFAVPARRDLFGHHLRFFNTAASPKRLERFTEIDGPNIGYRGAVQRRSMSDGPRKGKYLGISWNDTGSGVLDT